MCKCGHACRLPIATWLQHGNISKFCAALATPILVGANQSSAAGLLSLLTCIPILHADNIPILHRPSTLYTVLCLLILLVCLCLKSATAVPVEPGSMLWVIQRDFLQGKSVQQLVNDALAPVPNPSNDKAIADTNAIRASLTSIARNSTGYR